MVEPVTLAATAMGAQAISSWLGASKQRKMDRQTNAMNYLMAQDQMRFQERLSNTAHQREVADLRQAGLNPILSANGGASSPGGAFAKMENSGAQGELDAYGAADIYTAAKQQKLGEQMADAEIRDLYASAGLKETQSYTSAKQQELLGEQIKQTKAATEGIKFQNKILAPGAIKAGYDADMYSGPFGRAIHHVEQGVNTGLRMAEGIGRVRGVFSGPPEYEGYRDVEKYDNRGRRIGYTHESTGRRPVGRRR